MLVFLEILEKWGQINHHLGNMGTSLVSVILYCHLLISNLVETLASTNEITGAIPEFAVLKVPIFKPWNNTAYGVNLLLYFLYFIFCSGCRILLHMLYCSFHLPGHWVPHKVLPACIIDSNAVTIPMFPWSVHELWSALFLITRYFLHL